MKTKNALCGLAIAVALQMGMLAGSAQTNIYLFSGSETNITLPPGTYIIAAYGADGGSGYSGYNAGGVGDWVSAVFNFSMSTNLTLLVGGRGGDGGGVRAGGGGGGSFVVEGSTPLVIAGGGGGGGGAYTDIHGGNGGDYGPNGGPGGFRGDAGGDGLGGTGGGGGGGGIGINSQYSAGGGGGGFLGDGTYGTGYGNLQGGGSGGGAGGGSFESGGGNPDPYYYSNGGFGGGGGGGTGTFSNGGGGGGGYSGGGGAGDENIAYDAGGGGGGGSIIDSSAIAILGPGPYFGRNGEIIITALPPPLTNADGSIYTYSTNADGSANIVTYAGPPWVVTIPTDINGLTVTSIGEDAFAYTSLTSITIPDSVTDIGELAFYECTNLTNATIGSGVTSIGDFAFYACTSLANATIGSGVTSIGYAFGYCSSLTSITIPDSVTDIGSLAFYECTNLTSVYFTGNAPSPTNDSTVFSSDPATVYYLPGTTGWGAMFDGRPTAPWFLPNPQILDHSAGFGVQPGGFGFTISWATNASVVVEAATNLANPVWIPVSTNTLTGGTNYFSDPQWTNYPGRFYRLRSP
jgi:hypothetical protein